MNHKLYLSDPGIRLDGKKFFYNKNNVRVTESAVLERLSKLRVPPAWSNLWYASNVKCHIQVHGIDSSGKKQYILSQDWINNSKSEKFNRMKSFIRNLNGFRKKIIISPREPQSKELIIKLLFNLLIDTHIRVGNEIYAEQNKTYGLTTLLQKHLILKDSNYYLSFVGKSKIKHSILIPEKYNPFIKHLILPNKNKPLFYYLENNKIKAVSSEELNSFLKENMGENYTCKDFRTYSANVLFIKYFLKNVNKGKKKCIIQSIDSSAKELGHTRNISKKSYISDNLLNYWVDSFETASLLTSSVLLTKVWDSRSSS
jgi:DNA topoisomerase-1